MVGRDAICVSYNEAAGCTKPFDQTNGGCKFKGRVLKHLCATVVTIPATGTGPMICGAQHTHLACPRRKP